VSRNQKKHSPTYIYCGHQSSLICFVHLLRSMASSLFTHLTVFLHNLSPSFLWSTSWPHKIRSGESLLSLSSPLPFPSSLIIPLPPSLSSLLTFPTLPKSPQGSASGVNCQCGPGLSPGREPFWCILSSKIVTGGYSFGNFCNIFFSETISLPFKSPRSWGTAFPLNLSADHSLANWDICIIWDHKYQNVKGTIH